MQQPPSATTPKSIIVLRERKLVSNKAYPNGKDVDVNLKQRLEKFKKQQADKQASLEMKTFTNLDETTLVNTTDDKSTFSECRRKNGELLAEMKASIKSPHRVSEEQKNRTLLLSGNNNENDSATSSLGDDRSFSFSGGEDIVDLDALKAKEQHLVAKEKDLKAREERLVAEKKAIIAKTRVQLRDHYRKNEILNTQLAEVGTPTGDQLFGSFQSLVAPMKYFVRFCNETEPEAAHPLERVTEAENDHVLDVCNSAGLGTT